jgi:hypothetical protein
MGRVSVINAVNNYLVAGQTADALPLLGTVFPYAPKLTQAGAFAQGQEPGAGAGSVLYLHLRHGDERRLSSGPSWFAGPTPAKKLRIWVLGMIIVFRSQQATAEQAGLGNDTLMDDLVLWIERDRKCGTGSIIGGDGYPPGDGSGTIFQWGESDPEAPSTDIVQKSGMPKTLRGQSVQIWSTIDIFTIEEVMT